MTGETLTNSERYRRQIEDAVHDMATQWPASMRRNLTHPEARAAVAKHVPASCRRCQEQD